MPAYIVMNSNGRSAVIRNQLWLRKYYFTKQSRMRYRSRYHSHGFWHPFSDVGIHSSY